MPAIATVWVQTTAPLPPASLARVLAEDALCTVAMSDSLIKVTAETDTATLSRSVAASLDSFALTKPGLVVPEQVSEVHFNVRPAVG